MGKWSIDNRLDTNTLKEEIESAMGKLKFLKSFNQARIQKVITDLRVRGIGLMANSSQEK